MVGNKRVCFQTVPCRCRENNVGLVLKDRRLPSFGFARPKANVRRTQMALPLQVLSTERRHR
jgi:hypothetical protein